MSIPTCISILSTGPKKGSACGGHVVSNNLCGKHAHHIAKKNGSVTSDKPEHISDEMDTVLALTNIKPETITYAHIADLQTAFKTLHADYLKALPVINAHSRKQTSTKGSVARKREEYKAQGLNVDGTKKFADLTPEEQFAIFMAGRAKAAETLKKKAEQAKTLLAPADIPAVTATPAVPVTYIVPEDIPVVVEPTKRKVPIVKKTKTTA